MTFKTPTKRFLSKVQLEDLRDSQTHANVVAFVKQLNASVINVKLTDDVGDTRVDPILGVLDQVGRAATQTLPVDNRASRFGNPAFRRFYDEVEKARSLGFVLRVLGLNDGQRYYLSSGCSGDTYRSCEFFNRRIGLNRYGRMTYEDSTTTTSYRHPTPKAIHVPDIVDELAKDYMYFACIKFINSIKTASLRWHSPMLDDISAVKTWDKVNADMIKMYKTEVLGKLPVIQHFMFGSILPYTGRASDPTLTPSPLDREGGHGHEGGWGDCCGIHVPSAFAAAREEGARPRVIEGPGIRPVPFD